MFDTLEVKRVLVLTLLISAIAPGQEGWMPSPPGRVKSSLNGSSFTLGNDALMLSYSPASLRLRGWGGDWNAKNPELFQLRLKRGRILTAQNLNRLQPWKLESSPTGKRFTAIFQDPQTKLRVAIDVSMTDGRHYLRESVSLTSGDDPVSVDEVGLFRFALGKTARVIGSVLGSPISDGSYFLGLEHPMANNHLAGGVARTEITRKAPLQPRQTVTYSAVLGVETPGQQRRAFQSYVESERARPYAPFLHYNSWYDLGYFNRFNEADCVERINTFGQELKQKRGVKLSSFLFDDGWDDTNTNWEFHSGFPNGFAPLKAAAARYGAAPGVWLSPWGGYGKPREERLATGKRNGLEVDGQGFALSGPKYYDLFRRTCMRMVTEYGINQFKLDGTGSPDKQYPGSAFDSDFDAAINLIEDLRVANPSLFVNLTTGTWPSPFWTRYADSIWRGGSDHDFAGVGPDRERWITYRDSDTNANVVRRGPLFPLNSLMLHGLIYARYAHNLSSDPSHAFRHEVASYFGTGTQLQEMYITPSLLSKSDWDNLARWANWSRENAPVLRDSHWVGGNPEALEVYGWGSWTPRKSILTLRNPSDSPQAFAIEPAEMLEVPKFAQKAMKFTSVTRDGRPISFSIPKASSKVVTLQPFEVLILEGEAR